MGFAPLNPSCDLLQAGIYCGVLAALKSFRIASEVLEEMDKK
jgi:hypothetical protein